MCRLDRAFVPCPAMEVSPRGGFLPGSKSQFRFMIPWTSGSCHDHQSEDSPALIFCSLVSIGQHHLERSPSVME